MKICYRHFCGRHEKELIYFRARTYRLQILGSCVVPIMHSRHTKKGGLISFVTMLACVQIEHELNQASLQPRANAGKTNENRSRSTFRAVQRSKSLKGSFQW